MAEPKEKEERGEYIKLKDLKDTYGFTKGCTGCDHAQTHLARIQSGKKERYVAKSHSEECRNRIQEEMATKEPERYAKALEKAVMVEEKKAAKREREEQKRRKQGSGARGSNEGPDREEEKKEETEEREKEETTKVMEGGTQVEKKRDRKGMEEGTEAQERERVRKYQRTGNEEVEEVEEVIEEEEEMGNLMYMMSAGEQQMGPKWKGWTRWDDGVTQMEGVLSQMGERTHVAEIYSPPRVTEMARGMGLTPGLAMDLSTVDPEDGQPWDFNNQEKAMKAEEYVRRIKPVLLIGSPMCTAFSQLQSFN